MKQIDFRQELSEEEKEDNQVKMYEIKKKFVKKQKTNFTKSANDQKKCLGQDRYGEMIRGAFMQIKDIQDKEQELRDSM